MKLVTLFALLAASIAPAQEPPPARWSIASERKAVAVGDRFAVKVSVEIDPSWHVYAATQPAGGPIPMAIDVPGDQPFRLTGRIDSPKPKIARDPNFNIDTQFFEEHATFTVPLQVTVTGEGNRLLSVEVLYQTCNDTLCLPPTTEELKLAVVIGDSRGNVKSVVPPPPEPIAPKPNPTSPPVIPLRVPDMAAASMEARTLSGYVGLAMLMGALSLLTPCVFPMVPITVSYFTNRAGKSRRDSLLQAIVYGLGIILTFTAVGFTIAVGFGASGLNRFAADPWLNLAVTALFVTFALSLFGIYELALPARLLTLAAKSHQGQGRIAGTLLMGLAFTLTSFTCTAPFLGALFVVASQGNWQWPLAGMLAFSTVFALPFIVLALVPQLVAAMPRSGPWLVAVKVTMGLLELAAAMKFLSNADLVWGWGIFTRQVVIASWLVIAALLLVYLSGLVRLGNAPRLGSPRLGRIVAAAVCVLLLVWLASGLSGRRLGELEAFLPPADAAALNGVELTWLTNDYDRAIAEARRQDRPILVDFTGYTCTNCRWMEANMFPRPEVTRELARYVRVRLYTDGRGDFYRRFQEMERHLFGTVALPYYAVLTPSGQPVVAFGGLTRDSSEYINFLRKGLE